MSFDRRSGGGVPTLSPCTESDFSGWKLKTVAALMAYGLLEVCELPIAVVALTEERARTLAAKQEADKAPGAPASSSSSMSLQAGDDAQGKADRDAKNMIKDASKRAYSALIGALNRSQLTLVQHVSIGDAHGVWQVLLVQYERKSVATRVALIEQLLTIKMEGSEHVALYVARVQGLVRKLAEQEELISDTILLFVLLRGLPSRFGTLVTLLKMKDSMVLDHVIEALKNEEERMKSAPSTHQMEDTVHYAGVSVGGKFHKRNGGGGGGGGGDRASGSGPMRCYTCGEGGHIKFHCPQNKNRKKCERCHRVGHLVTECRAIHKAEEEHANFIREMKSKGTWQDDSEEEEWC
jgi:Trp operon repressor